MIPHSITARSVSVLVDGRMAQVPSSSPNFEELKTELRKKEPDIARIKILADITKFISLHTSGDVKIGDGAVLYRDKPVHQSIATRMVTHLTDGDAIDPLCRMLEKCMSNPNDDIHTDLFMWLENSGLPVAEDGDVLAFKVVRSNYLSKHDGKTPNFLGTTVKMDRSKCEWTRETACGTGLHFCSAGYISGFYSSGDRVVIVKINPYNITSFPSRGSEEKGRCCEQEIIGEIPKEDIEKFGGNVKKAFGSYNAEEIVEHMNVPGNPEPEKMKVKIRPEVEDSEEREETLFTNAGGSKYTAQVILRFVKDKGKTGAANAMAVPRSTLYGWLQRIEADGIELQPEKPVEIVPEAKVSETGEKVFEREGKKYTAATLLKAVEKEGQRGASLKLGIPRSTLWGWLQEIKG